MKKTERPRVGSHLHRKEEISRPVKKSASRKTETAAPNSSSRLKPESDKKSRNTGYSLEFGSDSLQEIKDENKKLRQELEQMKQLYDQLVREGPTEKYEERRVHLLKSQLIQLERQVILQSEALNARSVLLLDVGNSLEKMSQLFRELLSKESPGSAVSIERAQLTHLIETTEGARHRLFKNVENSSSENHSQALLFMSEFLKPSKNGENKVTVFDVCYGRTQHLNLRHVAKLESKLFATLKQLFILQQHLSLYSVEDNSHLDRGQHIHNKKLRDRLEGLLSVVLPLLEECCQGLLELSILVPSAPWPVLKKSVRQDITIEQVVAALPSFAKSKHKQVQETINALLKASSYIREVSKLESKACAEELRFHQDIYDVQMQYTHAVFQAIQDSYAVFEDELKEVVCSPVQELLTEFSALKDAASEEALKTFLVSFKTHADQLQLIIDRFQTNDTNEHDNTVEGATTLSAFRQDFNTKVDQLIQKYSEKRETVVEELEETKRLRDLHLEGGMGMFQSGDQNGEGDV